MKRLMQAALAMLLTFLAGTAFAADLLGPGDLIRITVYGSPDLTTETRVAQTGQISFPLIGTVPVAGQTVAQAERAIASKLESGGFVKKPAVNIVVTALQSQLVSVMGQVNRPGRFPLEGKRGVMDLLALAGGIGADGGDVITLLRTRNGTSTREEIDVIEMVRAGQLTKDYELQAGDVIFVERAPKFYIYGEVARPGGFRLERGMNVTQALAAGGGLSARGTERGLMVKRRGADGKLQAIPVKGDDLVQVDDVLFVKESWF